MRSYGQSLLLLLVALVTCTAAWRAPDGATMYVVTAILLLTAWVVSPMFFPRHRDFRAVYARVGGSGRPLVLWRPGCMFCVRMRIALGVRGRQVDWVNIWRSPDAAAYVRSVNDGNETVPTVVVGADVRTNPDPSWVRDRIASVDT